MLSSRTQPSDNKAFTAILWVGLFTAILIPVWSVHYLATTDGGAHLANADIVRHFVSGGSGAYASFYVLNSRPVPNWLGHFILAILLSFVRPAVAEKLLMSGYLILLPLAVRYAVTGVKKSAGFIAFLAVPLSLNGLTSLGFYNFSSSVVVFFFALGFWLRYRERMNLVRGVALMAMGFLLYAGHLSSILLFAGTVAILAGWFTLARSYRAGRLLGRDAISRVVVTGVALLPAVGLAAWFQHRGFEGKPPGLKLAITNLQYWKDLLQLSFMTSFHGRPEKWLGRLMALLLGAMLIGIVAHKVRRRSWLRRDGLILPPLALVCLYFLQGASQHQELFIPQRLTYYSALLLLPFLAAQSYSRIVRAGVVCASCALALALTASHWKPLHEFDAQVSEYIAAGDHIEPHATFLSLVYSARGQPLVSDPSRFGVRVAPFFSIQGYIAIDRQAIDLRNYEAGTDYFPVRFRPDVDPFKLLARPDRYGKNGLLMAVPQIVDIPAYEAVSHKHVDYVLMWGLEQVTEPSALKTLAHIHAAYDLTYKSPAGRVQLWHRKPTVQ